eukprot:9491291-Pyramimonas_sp.AAC.1
MGAIGIWMNSRGQVDHDVRAETCATMMALGAVQDVLASKSSARVSRFPLMRRLSSSASLWRSPYLTLRQEGRSCSASGTN